MIGKKTLTAMALAVSLYFCPQAFAGLEQSITQAGLKMQDVRDVTTFYYQNPQPEKMIAVLKVLVTVKEFTSDTKHFPIVAHIFVSAAHHDKQVLDKMIALRDGLTGESKDLVSGMINEAQNFQSPQSDNPANIDLLWAEFFATGEAEPVQAIIQALDRRTPNGDKLLVGLTQWSLTSNVKQHKRVYDIVKEEAMKAKGETKQILENMLKEAQ